MDHLVWYRMAAQGVLEVDVYERQEKQPAWLPQVVHVCRVWKGGTWRVLTSPAAAEELMAQSGVDDLCIVGEENDFEGLFGCKDEWLETPCGTRLDEWLEGSEVEEGEVLDEEWLEQHGYTHEDGAMSTEAPVELRQVKYVWM